MLSAAGAAAYLGLLLYAGRGLRFDCWDGLMALMNALGFAGASPELFPVNMTRPPLGWLLLSPVAGGSYRSGGAPAALEAVQGTMPLAAAALAYACHRIYAGRWSAAPAAAAGLLLCLNPLLLRWAPFFLFDVFAALVALPFLYLGWRHARAPGTGNFLAMLAAYALAVLSRYQLALLALVPIAFGFFAPGRRARGGFLSPAWLLPPLGYAAALLALSLIRPGDFDLLRAHGELRTVWAVNLVEKEAAPRSFYLLSLARQLGPAGLALSLAGLWVWLKRRRPEDVYLALCLAVPIAFLSLAVANKEQRYGIIFLPAVYAALCEGLEALLQAGSGRAWRATALAGALILCPWDQVRASLKYISSEPSMRSRAPWILGELLRREVPEGGCVGWSGSDVLVRSAVTVLDKDEQMAMIGGPLLPLLAGRQARPWRGPGGSDCPIRLVVEATAGSEGEVLARIHEVLPSGSLKLRWKLGREGLLP